MVETRGGRYFRDQREIVRAIVDSHNTIWKTEVPSGLIDGSNVTFQSSMRMYPGSLSVFVDGVRKFDGIHYEVSDEDKITFYTAPTAGQEVVVEYVSPDQSLEI